MKQFFGTLNLILCLELIIAPMVPGLSAFSIRDAKAESCPQGTYRDSVLKRCITSDEVARVRNATSSCANIENQEEQQKCYMNNAESELSKGISEGDVRGDNTSLAKDSRFLGEGMGKVATGATVAVPLFFLTYSLFNKQKQGGFCKAPSLLLMYAGAGVLAAGEVISYFTHKKKLREIDEKWKEITNPSADKGTDSHKAQTTEAQSQAFEMLAQNEESLAKTANTKFIYHTASAGLFAAGAVVAAFEIGKLNAAYASLAAPDVTGATKVAAYQTINKLECKNTSKQQKDAQEQADKEAAAAPKETTSLFNNDLDGVINAKYAAQALRNLEKAENLEEALELIKEIESLEFENYSKLSYLGPELEGQQLKKIKIDNIVSRVLINTFFPEAHADNGKAINEGNPIMMDEVVVTAERVPVTSVQSQIKSVGATSALSIPEKLEEIKLVTTTSSTGTAEQYKGIMRESENTVDKMISRPAWRTALNGVFGTWIGIQAGTLKKQVNIFKERADFLRGIKADFNHTAGLLQCTEAQRSDPQNPGCYCYTPEGKRNSSRLNSQICQSLWSGRSLNDSSYYANASTEKTCIDSKDQVDSTCACRATRSCKRVTNVGIGLSNLSPGVFKMMGSAVGPANDLMGGNASAADINGDATLSNAAALRRVANEYIKKSNPKTAQDIAKLEGQAAKSLTAASNGLSMGLGSGSGSNFSNMTPQQAAAELEKELEKSSAAPSIVSGGSAASPDATPMMMGEDLEFGLTAEDLAAQQGEISGVMAKNLDYGENDINQGSSANIFEVLSNRYMRSGMRRLFDDEGKTKADLPAETDINQ